ncbi:MAG TPA: J domain-containing protein [Kofleriaceae bacterium]|jgi:hypothetical protein
MSSRDVGRTLHVRCATWEQVEIFHTRKLRRGKLLSMKVPFATDAGARVTVGLELPSQVTIAIDGVVLKASPIAGEGKTWIEVELIGFTEDVVAQIRKMAADSAAAAAAVKPPEKPAPEPDEKDLFQHFTAELRRLRTAAVHDVLGVPRDANAEAVRRGWQQLIARVHPDLVARRGSPAIAHLAEELTILANRAYDRLRAALVAEGRATAIGPTLSSPPGWLVGFDDMQSTGSGLRARVAAAPTPAPKTPAPPSAGGGGDMFEVRARTMLGDGDAANAQEVLAAALCVYPRSRPLRSLYYVASAITALEKGEVMLATSQLETALAHHESCTEAAALLEIVRSRPTPSEPVPGPLPPDVSAEMRRLFQGSTSGSPA